MIACCCQSKENWTADPYSCLQEKYNKSKNVKALMANVLAIIPATTNYHLAVLSFMQNRYCLSFEKQEIEDYGFIYRAIKLIY